MSVRNLVKLFKALSDETRIRILHILLERECCVCEVMQALNISQSRASRNLGILEDAGFIKSRRDGLWILYSIDAEAKEGQLASLVETLRSSLTDDQTVLQDKERLAQAVRTSPRAMGK